eukprot:4049714-Prymnesium_polylepis.1
MTTAICSLSSGGSAAAPSVADSLSTQHLAALAVDSESRPAGPLPFGPAAPLDLRLWEIELYVWPAPLFFMRTSNVTFDRNVLQHRMQPTPPPKTPAMIRIMTRGAPELPLEAERALTPLSMGTTTNGGETGGAICMRGATGGTGEGGSTGESGTESGIEGGTTGIAKVPTGDPGGGTAGGTAGRGIGGNISTITGDEGY